LKGIRDKQNAETKELSADLRAHREKVRAVRMCRSLLTHV